ncbi:MAG: hypothetical protein ACRCTY_10840 [Candidatus Adiutrix sp.]
MALNGTAKISTQGLSLIFLLMVASALAACVQTVKAPFTSTSVGRDIESFAEFKDVPYPSNMSFLKSESFTYTRRGTLAGVVVVSGRMTKDEVGAFYDAHLPNHGWAPLAEVNYNTSLVASWAKDNKVLTIITRPLPLAVTPEIKVELWVAPPHTKDDLGRRTIYQHSTSTRSSRPNSFFGNIFNNDIKEENI